MGDSSGVRVSYGIMTWFVLSPVHGVVIPILKYASSPFARAQTSYELETFVQNWEKSSELTNFHVKYFPKSLENTYIRPWGFKVHARARSR
jgi:hypothetical protein